MPAGVEESGFCPRVLTFPETSSIFEVKTLLYGLDSFRSSAGPEPASELPIGVKSISFMT